MLKGIYHHLNEALEGIYSRFVQNVIAKPTFSTRRDAIHQDDGASMRDVTSLKMYFRPRLTAAASRILKSLMNTRCSLVHNQIVVCFVVSMAIQNAARFESVNEYANVGDAIR